MKHTITKTLMLALVFAGAGYGTGALLGAVSDKVKPTEYRATQMMPSLVGPSESLRFNAQLDTVNLLIDIRDELRKINAREEAKKGAVR